MVSGDDHDVFADTFLYAIPVVSEVSQGSPRRIAAIRRLAFGRHDDRRRGRVTPWRLAGGRTQQAHGQSKMEPPARRWRGAFFVGPVNAMCALCEIGWRCHVA